MRVIVEQGDLLDALMSLIKDQDTDAAAEILRKLVKESEPVGVSHTNGNGPISLHVDNQKMNAAIDASRAETLKARAAAKEPSPSSKRLDELRDLHGPVFRILPQVPVTVGQKISNADGRVVEMIEKDEHGDAGAWFGKLVEA